MTNIELYKLQSGKKTTSIVERIADSENRSTIENYILAKQELRDRYILNGDGYNRWFDEETDRAANVIADKLIKQIEAAI